MTSQVRIATVRCIVDQRSSYSICARFGSDWEKPSPAGPVEALPPLQCGAGRQTGRGAQHFQEPIAG